MNWAREASELIAAFPGFEIVTPPILSLFSFRCPGDDNMQQRLVDALNDDGRIYVTQGAFEGRKMTRFQVGQFHTNRDDVIKAFYFSVGPSLFGAIAERLHSHKIADAGSRIAQLGTEVDAGNITINGGKAEVPG